MEEAATNLKSLNAIKFSNMSDKETVSIIDEMLTKLAAGRRSMERQSQTISDILDKSNNVLLHIEATRAHTATTHPSHYNHTQDITNFQTYKCGKETVQTLAKIIENAAQLFDTGATRTNAAVAPNLHENVLQFEQYLELHHQRSEYLGSSVRKLVAVSDNMSQLKAILDEAADAPDTPETHQSFSSD